MIKFRNNKSKPLTVLLFSVLTLFIITVAVYFAENILTWELEGIIYTFSLACIAIPFHIFAKRSEFLYIISWAMNSFGIGLGISSYYDYNKIPLDLTQMLFAALFSAFLLVVVCLLLYKFKNAKKTILITAAVITLSLVGASIVFWIVNGGIFFSFGFFCLAELSVWLFVCAVTVNVPKRHILRDISFGGFGIAIITVITVLSLIVEDDCGIEGLSESLEFGESLGVKKKRRK